MVSTEELKQSEKILFEKIREIVCEKMKEKDLSVYQLAREAEISSQVVAKMIAKKTVTIVSLAKVMKTIGVDILLL